MLRLVRSAAESFVECKQKKKPKGLPVNHCGGYQMPTDLLYSRPGSTACLNEFSMFLGTPKDPSGILVLTLHHYFDLNAF